MLSALGCIRLGVAGLGALSNGFGNFDSGGPDQTGPAFTAAGGLAPIIGGVVLIALHARTGVAQEAN